MIILKDRTRFSGKQLIFFAFAFCLVGGIYIVNSFASACNLTAPASSTTDRKVQLTVTGCSGTQYFRVSESPDFGATSGVQVKINNVASDKSYADVSVTYPNGTPAMNSAPYTIPAQPHQTRMLAVLFTFEDDNGQIAGLGSYENPAWLQKLVFGDGGVGFEGHFSKNSIKDYIFQSSNGQVNLTGSVYPQVVRLPLEKYRQFLGSGGNVQGNFGEDILKYINATNPGYLNNYDFLLGLSSEQYAVQRFLYPNGSSSVQAGDFGSIKNSITYAIPVDTSKSIFANTIQDTRTSTDATTVVTRYNVNSSGLEGVWLASDTSRTGTNYYTGGSITSTPDTQFQYLKLGTALPNPNTQVIVRYKANISSQVASSTSDQVSSYGWYNHFMHELQHQISVSPGYSFSQRTPIGDMYFQPALGASYDLMANGTTLTGFDQTLNTSIDSPSLLGAYHRSILGYATPFTLNYGQNENTVRVYRAETGDPANNGRTTMIKIPLLPPGDVGFNTRVYCGTDNCSPTNTSKQYRGNEYLLLEWRYKGENLENNLYNFDRLIPSEGLAVYHLVEAAPYGITAASNDIARIQDATPDNPAFTEGFSDTSSSPALFGPQSGVTSYTANTGSFWQTKPAANDSQTFDYLLSPGVGTKTLYAQYADSNGNILGTQQIIVDLSSNQQPAERLPTMSIDLTDGTAISSARNIVATYAAPNGTKNIRFYVDDVSRLEKKEPNISATSESININPLNYSSGPHQLKVVFYDSALNKVTSSASFSTAGGISDTSQPGAFLSAPVNGSSVWGTVNISTSSVDNIGIVKNELYIDGSLVFSTKSSIVSYNWYTAQTPNGSHTILVKAYDASGNVGSAQSGVTVQNTTSAPVDTTPPTISLTSPTDGSNVSGNVPLTANGSDNVGVTKVEFYVDGGLKSTGSPSPYGYIWDSTSVSNGSHTITAKAYDAAGNNSTDQIFVNVNNGDTTPPSTPTGLSATAPVYNRVSISWSASTDNAAVTGYYIIRGGITIANSAGTGTSFSDTSVNASTSYSYQVMAYDAAGNLSNLSSSVNVATPSTPDTQAPTAPINLTATAVSSSQINLSWSVASDNIGVVGYDIYRNGTKLTTINGSSYGDTGLSPSTLYTYYVVAKDAAGNTSPQSNSTSATTQAQPPSTGNLVGTVSSSKGGVVSGAAVSLAVGSGKNAKSFTASTNTYGLYSLSGIPSGNYSVKYSKSGFTTQTGSVSITANTTKDVTLVSRK